MKRILTYSLWIDSAVVIALLSRTLFPDFLQASYFEAAACLFISTISFIACLAILVYAVEASKNKKTNLFKDNRNLGYDKFSDLIIGIAAIYSSHYIIGIFYLLVKSIFRHCVKEERKQNE